MSVFTLISIFAILAFLETQWSFRVKEEPERRQRWDVNFLAFGLSSFVSVTTQIYLISEIGSLQGRALVSLDGFLPQSFAESGALFALRICIEVAALDLLLYFWHRMNHKVGLFWRFHQFHHLDPFLDVTTALRFHPCEILLSQCFRLVVFGGLALATGIAPLSLVLFQSFAAAGNMFHHSNLRLSQKLENMLARVIVTPRHHQNHHSWYLNETDSNYGTIFAFWDAIFGTKTVNRKPAEVSIGLPTHTKALVNSMSLLDQLLTSLQPIRRWPEKFLERHD